MLKTLIHDRVPEDIHLEFKTKKDRSVPELDPSDAWQFSGALSDSPTSMEAFVVVNPASQKMGTHLKPISSVVDSCKTEEGSYQFYPTIC